MTREMVKNLRKGKGRWVHAFVSLVELLWLFKKIFVRYQRSFCALADAN